MKIRGWVYVLLNKSMPGLLKIGFSTKDPALRVRELGGTGLPHDFEIAYDALVESPRDLEQLVHKRLIEYHEAKEFFRIDLEFAVDAIREVAETEEIEILVENGDFLECEEGYELSKRHPTSATTASIDFLNLGGIPSTPSETFAKSEKILEELGHKGWKIEKDSFKWILSKGDESHEIYTRKEIVFLGSTLKNR